MLMKTIAIDYGSTGIRSNSVCPAWVRTDMGDAMMDELGEQQGIDREAAYRWANRFNPMRRPATLDEVAGRCCSSPSPAAGYVNGAAIPIDGGAQLRQHRAAVGRDVTLIEHFIDGRRVGSEATFEDHSPIDWSKIADVARGNERHRRPGGDGGGERVPGVGRAGRRPDAPCTCGGWPT